MKTYLLIPVFLTAVIASVASEKQPLDSMPNNLTLDEALEIAQAYNPSLKQARIGLISKEAAIRQVRASAMPKLVGIADHTYYDEKRLQAFGPESTPEDRTWSTRAEASMPIFSGGRNRFAVQGAKADRAASEYDLTSLEHDVAIMVHETYLNALLAKASAHAQQEEIDLLHEQFQRSEKRFKVGVGSRFDVLQAEVVLANAKPQLVRETNNYRRAVDRLSRLLGLSLESTQEAGDIVLVSLGAPKPLFLQMQEALVLAENQRPEIAAMDLTIQAQEKQGLVNKRSNWPLLEVFSNYGIQSDQFGGEDLEGWTAGLRLNWSFYDGGERKSKMDQDEQQLNMLAQKKAELLLEVSGEVREALYNYEEAWEILMATKKVIEQGEEALRMAQDRHDSGKGTQLDVFVAQTQLTEARLERLKAEQDCHFADASFRRALGE